MSTFSSLRQLFGGSKSTEEETEPREEEVANPAVIKPAVPIAPNDPLMAYLLTNPAAFEVEKLNLDSSALQSMDEAGVKIAVPLVSQGELVGLLSLGSRLSEQDYSSDDRRLLNSLAAQAAPALRVAQLARQQQAAAAERERIEQELRVARIIQQTLLPKEVPQLSNWKVEAYWQPARAVGGDFYDFVTLEDGRMCVIAADVTDKGVPAALVMASARSVLRAAAERLASPGEILRRVNDTLCPDIPPKMFVTCLCLIFDPESGHIIFANAGHNLPIVLSADGVAEPRATGMPLGLMPGMDYEETETELAPGDRLLLYSDGIDEAHAPDGEMFGIPRIRDIAQGLSPSQSFIDALLDNLAAFTGEDWEQEDDVTFVLLQRTDGQMNSSHNNESTTIAEFEVSSEPGNERQAIDQVEEAVQNLDLPELKLEQLKTAVGEATMNAMEHGNQYDPEKPVVIRVRTSPQALTVEVHDHGLGQPAATTVEPDLDAKLDGLQSPRGWGLFLIQNMVDDMQVHDNADGHIIELTLYLEGDTHG